MPKRPSTTTTGAISIHHGSRRCVAPKCGLAGTVRLLAKTLLVKAAARLSRAGSGERAGSGADSAGHGLHWPPEQPCVGVSVGSGVGDLLTSFVTGSVGLFPLHPSRARTRNRAPISLLVMMKPPFGTAFRTFVIVDMAFISRTSGRRGS